MVDKVNKIKPRNTNKLTRKTVTMKSKPIEGGRAKTKPKKVAISTKERSKLSAQIPYLRNQQFDSEIGNFLLSDAITETSAAKAAMVGNGIADNTADRKQANDISEDTNKLKDNLNRNEAGNLDKKSIVKEKQNMKYMTRKKKSIDIVRKSREEFNDFLVNSIISEIMSENDNFKVFTEGKQVKVVTETSADEDQTNVDKLDSVMTKPMTDVTSECKQTANVDKVEQLESLVDVEDSLVIDNVEMEPVHDENVDRIVSSDHESDQKRKNSEKATILNLYKTLYSEEDFVSDQKNEFVPDFTSPEKDVNLSNVQSILDSSSEQNNVAVIDLEKNVQKVSGNDDNQESVELSSLQESDINPSDDQDVTENFDNEDSKLCVFKTTENINNSNISPDENKMTETAPVFDRLLENLIVKSVIAKLHSALL